MRAAALPYAADRVAVADVPVAVARGAVEVELVALLTRPADGDVRLWRADVPAVATLVGILEPLLATLPDRRTAMAWHDVWLPRLGGSSTHSNACCRTHRRVSLARSG